MISSMMLLVIGSTLLGCSSQPAATPAQIQTKEQDAKAKMTEAFANDPALHKPGSGSAPPGVGTPPVMNPGSGR